MIFLEGSALFGVHALKTIRNAWRRAEMLGCEVRLSGGKSSSSTVLLLFALPGGDTFVGLFFFTCLAITLFRVPSFPRVLLPAFPPAECNNRPSVVHDTWCFEASPGLDHARDVIPFNLECEI